MAERLEAREAQARQLGAVGLPRRRKRGEIAVAEGEHHEFRGRLLVINGWGRLIERCRAGDKQVHVLSSRDDLADGGRVEALLTDHDERAAALLARQPSPVEMMLQAPADALHDKAHRLAL